MSRDLPGWSDYCTVREVTLHQVRYSYPSSVQHRLVRIWLGSFFVFIVRLVSVLHGHSFFHPCHNGQWPPTSNDFLSQIFSITFFFGSGNDRPIVHELSILQVITWGQICVFQCIAVYRMFRSMPMLCKMENPANLNCVACMFAWRPNIELLFVYRQGYSYSD